MATALVALAAVGGCGSGGAEDAGGTGTLTLGMTADIPGWDPADQPRYQGWAADAVYSTLIECDAGGAPLPDIAESWTFKKDNTGGTFKLRAGMKFSDGTPVNAEAVKKSYDYAKENAAGAPVSPVSRSARRTSEQ
ncbi:hypothetical protein BJF79_09455 [Actinomadura sp. CNU-125]|nr:hypothetical protein BJF79_09455 [Actinomadura sp. CNU-125]